MIVHLFAQCWNDEWMLPFFFRHYDRLVDQYFMYDDGSTDATLDMLRAHPRVAVRRFPRSNADSFVLSEQSFSNECWKESIGKADWVIVSDIDEHLYHPQWHAYLSRCRGEGVTLIPALGFQMISENLPQPGQTLCIDYPIGAPWEQMMKPSLFDPNAVTAMNFHAGRHKASPSGRIRVPASDEMLLFHYKYMSFDATYRRHRQLLEGLGATDVQRGWGHKYGWAASELKADWDEVARNAIDTTALRHDPAAHYPITPWWEKYRG